MVPPKVLSADSEIAKRGPRTVTPWSVIPKCDIPREDGWRAGACPTFESRVLEAIMLSDNANRYGVAVVAVGTALNVAVLLKQVRPYPARVLFVVPAAIAARYGGRCPAARGARVGRPA